MHIEQELQTWLTQYIPDRRKNKSRDIRIVLNYYGFGDLPWPTLEEIGEQLSVGTRERVRQIINSAFKDHVKSSQLPVASSAFDVIEKHDLIAVPELRAELTDLGLASADTTVRGVLNLARDMTRCQGYDLYDSALDKIGRSEAEFDSNTFLVNPDVLSELKTGLKKARTLPGLLGLSRFEYLRSELGATENTERVITFVDESPNAIKLNVGNERWYIYEDRDNTLVNCCEKIFSLTDSLDIDVLSHSLQNGLRRRSHRFDYPAPKIIREWIESSRWFRVNGKATEFLGEDRELTDIEKDIFDYLSTVQFAYYPPLRDHLLGKGYGKPAIDKAVTTSPLVYVDKSGQRKTYRYSLISKAGEIKKNDSERPNRYQEFKNRLKTLLNSGTDASSESFFRREQTVLREWLFGDKTESNCAICGDRFSVSALVTAHKKKRSICSESERVDPNIVFPLCVFGCDYLYESGSLKVVEGQILAGKVGKSNTRDRRRVKELGGKYVDNKWLCGELAYFK